MNKETLLKKYKWLGDNPIVEDCGSHFKIYKEKDASPLILKNYEGK